MVSLKNREPTVSRYRDGGISLEGASEEEAALPSIVALRGRTRTLPAIHLTIYSSEIGGIEANKDLSGILFPSATGIPRSTTPFFSSVPRLASFEFNVSCPSSYRASKSLCFLDGSSQYPFRFIPLSRLFTSRAFLPFLFVFPSFFFHSFGR